VYTCLRIYMQTTAPSLAGILVTDVYFALPDLPRICPFSLSFNPHFESKSWISLGPSVMPPFCVCSRASRRSRAYPFADQERYRTSCDYLFWMIIVSNGESLSVMRSQQSPRKHWLGAAPNLPYESSISSTANLINESFPVPRAQRNRHRENKPMVKMADESSC
jgi:hypothetical protein